MTGEAILSILCQPACLFKRSWVDSADFMTPGTYAHAMQQSGQHSQKKPTLLPCIDSIKAEWWSSTVTLGMCAGIRQGSERRSRERVHDYTVWEPRFRNGLSRTGQYIVVRPASRRYVEHYDQPIYELQPQHIKAWHIKTGWRYMLLYTPT